MSNVLLINAILEENKYLREQVNGTASTASNWCTCPTDTTTWSSIPRLTDGTCVNVCDATDYKRCGATCTWTVPSGISFVQFQIWGAGSGTAPGCCCSGSPQGDTGAYALVIVPAVAGCQYTICAGCAHVCCASSSGGNAYPGCQSYVTGQYLTNVCAPGGGTGSGANGLYCLAVDHWGSLHGCCRFAYKDFKAAGACICDNSSYCFASSCATCGEIPITYVGAGTSTCKTFCGSVSCGYITGLPSLHAGGCFDTNHYGYFISAPVIGFDHCPFTNSCCCSTFTSGTCCGYERNAVNGIHCYPGQGGGWNHMMGGNNSGIGGHGRMGMVRITYC